MIGTAPALTDQNSFVSGRRRSPATLPDKQRQGSL
jgi:hypothetical protein